MAVEDSLHFVFFFSLREKRSRRTPGTTKNTIERKTSWPSWFIVFFVAPSTGRVGHKGAVEDSLGITMS